MPLTTPGRMKHPWLRKMSSESLFLYRISVKPFAKDRGGVPLVKQQAEWLHYSKGPWGGHNRNCKLRYFWRALLLQATPWPSKSNKLEHCLQPFLDFLPLDHETTQVDIFQKWGHTWVQSGSGSNTDLSIQLEDLSMSSCRPPWRVLDDEMYSTV